jgi:hypothetical protein
MVGLGWTQRGTFPELHPLGFNAAFHLRARNEEAGFRMVVLLSQRMDCKPSHGDLLKSSDTGEELC